MKISPAKLKAKYNLRHFQNIRRVFLPVIVDIKHFKSHRKAGFWYAEKSNKKYVPGVGKTKGFIIKSI
jgi:hypothetical protein